MKKSFDVKDLITVGVFTALYFVVTFAAGCLGFIPIFMVFMPLIAPIFGSMLACEYLLLNEPLGTGLGVHFSDPTEGFGV